MRKEKYENCDEKQNLKTPSGLRKNTKGTAQNAGFPLEGSRKISGERSKINFDQGQERLLRMRALKASGGVLPTQ